WPANARQVMYAARPRVLELTGGECWKQSSYFTQKLLPSFVKTHPDLTKDWDVVFDARGHLREPHTGCRIGLGTVGGRKDVEEWNAEVEEQPSIKVAPQVRTVGPANRYHFALFVEKEGFDALLDRAEIAQRFDVAPMSTKGMSVTAARELVERLSEEGVTVLVLR